jgi:tRNA uridine 5-carbamoylmethylation protein Kti12
MPLILITGIPSSGKSTQALQIKSFFEDVHGKVVYLINENDIIVSSKTEKSILFLGKSSAYSLIHVFVCKVSSVHVYG